jgi:Double zinc ribbon
LHAPVRKYVHSRLSIPMPLALFGLDGGVGLVVNLLILFLIVVYLALIWWTYLDARRRIEDPVLIACATAASVFPYLGTIVYTILRPPEFLEDREERELELRAAELELRQRIEQSCPHCEYPIERSYLRCPNCERRLRNPCRKCHKPLDPKWGICPYCETEVRRERPARETREGREGRRADRQRTARAAAQRQAMTDRTDRIDRSERADRTDRTDRTDGPTRRQPRPVAAREERPSRSSRSSR